MPQLYTDEGVRVGVLAGRKELHVKHALDCDEKTLYFKYPRSGPYAAQLVTEAYVRTKTDEFVIKEVAGDNTTEWISVTANMNTEGIENCTFAGGFEAVEMTIDAVLNLALEDSDWTVGVCTVTKKRTIRKEEDCNAWDVLKQCVSTYRCEVEIDTLRKVINIYEARGQNRGLHFMEGVNLAKLEYTRDTYDFYTQIIPIGKNGLTLLDDVDDPVLMLSNFTYSKKRVRRIWRDERYTNVKNLREDAAMKLAEACKPLSSYTGAVKDLAKGSTEHPEFFGYGVGDTIVLVSKATGIREQQRIVMVDEYENDQDNQVEINNVTKTFAQMQRDEQEIATETAARLANGYTDAQLEDYATTEEMEEVVQETTQGEMANLATKAELTNAAITAANQAQEAQEAAEATALEYANTAETNAKRSFQEALASYYTADEVDDLIAASSESDGNTAGATYATKVQLEEVRAQAVAAQETADAAQDDATDALEAAAAAQTTADDAKTTATGAQTTADAAMQKANVAQQAAQAAQDAANAAQDKETGTATTDDTGAVTVALTTAFATAAAGAFRVWLQPKASGELYVSESDTEGFTVTGTAALEFDWLAIRYSTTATTDETIDE